MQVLNVTNLPIYLPYNKAPVPFGDPIEGITATAAAPGVFTAPGYAPVNGDLIALSYLAGGSLPAPLTMGPIGQYPSFAGNSSPNPVGLAAAAYYVVGASGNTFNVSLTKGGSAITTTTTGASLVLHLLSGQVDGVTLPFKPGYTVVVENNSGGTLVLQGAMDAGQAAPGQGYNPPTGPGTWNTIVSLVTGAQANAALAYDWIRVSTAGTLVLQQN
jgi:hypothetical protein